MSEKLKYLINGTEHLAAPDEETSLLILLRDHLGMTGSKYGCGEGQCGACTVLVDGKPRRSCVTEARAVAGKPIITIEGLEKDGHLHPVQQGFLDTDAFQCGYCTPGMIMAGVGLLDRTADPSEQEILEALDRNICRCGTYPRIVAAIRKAAVLRKEKANG